MSYAGGVRNRLIRDNFRRMIEEALTELGWFDDNRNHLPLTIKSGPFNTSEEILPNVVGISVEDILSEELELGSILEETRHFAYVDIFAEDDPIGTQLAGDIFDIVRGKFSSLRESGIADGRLHVYDLSQATPSVIFYCSFEDFEINRNRDWDLKFNKFWWIIAVDIVDAYMDDEDD
jgi:hypothetical protein